MKIAEDSNQEERCANSEKKRGGAKYPHLAIDAGVPWIGWIE
jgi:hypothetical protein